MTDRIVLANIQTVGRHGVHDHERLIAQPFEVDVELVLDLRPAGTVDDLARTVDYAAVDAIVREVIDGPSRQLIEALAETIAGRIVDAFLVEEVIVRVRKPAVELGGPVDFAAVEIRRPGNAAPG